VVRIELLQGVIELQLEALLRSSKGLWRRSLQINAVQQHHSVDTDLTG